MSKKTIRVAVAGVGSCASALIQGIQWYKENQHETVGLTYPDIGGYAVDDIEFVVGFDVDERKVGMWLADAIYANPNCNMQVVKNVWGVVSPHALVHRGPTLDGIADHMRSLPEEVTFVESDKRSIDEHDYFHILLDNKVDVLLNYMPVGSEQASQFYIENAIVAGVHVINCMPSYISTESSMQLEELAVKYGVTIVGSDMRSQFGASRLSEVLQGAMLDSGLDVTQHLQLNMACGTTQGQENIRTGRTCNTDFLNMQNKERLYSKHVSKENVLNGQNKVRDQSIAGKSLFAGPSLTVMQKPGGKYVGTDNKVANLDIVAYGWAGARYELTARLSVQDSPNSSGIVADAIRFCKVASELGVVGFLRGPSAWSQKTPPVQMKTSDSKFECDALARRILTPTVEKQLAKNNPIPSELEWTFQSDKTDYDA